MMDIHWQRLAMIKRYPNFCSAYVDDTTAYYIRLYQAHGSILEISRATKTYPAKLTRTFEQLRIHYNGIFRSNHVIQ